MDTKAASSNPIYLDFEPSCKWQFEEGQDTLDINLEGFKKEQLNVQVNNTKNMLSIYGEKPLDASKWSRFRKEVNLPKDYAADEIQAKFSETNGILSIVMPKVANQPFLKPPEDKTKHVVASPTDPEDKTKDAVVTSSEPKYKTKNVVVATSPEPDDKTEDVVKISKSMAMKVYVVVVAAVVVVLFAIGTQIAQLVHRHPCQHLVNVYYSYCEGKKNRA